MCATPPAQMRMKELKAELDALGVTWRGVCFEKEDLVEALVQARLSPPPSAPPPAAPPAPAPSPAAPPAKTDAFGGFGSAVAQAEAEAAEVNAMSVDAIKAELAELGVDAAGGDDKTRLVSELLNARAFARPQFDSSAFGQKGTQW